MKQKRIKVRFNLGRGKNYMKWRIQYPSGQVSYYEPYHFQLIMNGCQAKNYKTTASKIFNGQNKTVCAWILCDDIEVCPFPEEPTTDIRLKYNPRVNPFWVLDNPTTNTQTNADNIKLDRIVTYNKSLFTY